MQQNRRFVRNHPPRESADTPVCAGNSFTDLFGEHGVEQLVRHLVLDVTPRQHRLQAVVGDDAAALVGATRTHQLPHAVVAEVFVNPACNTRTRSGVSKVL